MSKRQSLHSNTYSASKKRLKLNDGSRITFSTSYQEEDDVWGDDDDDEILLLASQACERITTNDISIHRIAPNVQAVAVKVQSTSKDFPQNETTDHHDNDADFLLKNAAIEANETRLNKYWKNNEDTLMKPLPPEEIVGISGMVTNEYVQSLLKQVKLLKVENDKLKMEHESLTMKCLNGQGESSILRSQLKTASGQLELYKLEAVKEKKKEHTVWNKTLEDANKEIQNFKSQLEFKKLEMENLKEKCKLLETSKLKSVESSTTTRESKWPNFSQTLNTSISKTDIKVKNVIDKREVCVQTSINNDIKLYLPNKDYSIFQNIPVSIFNVSKIEYSSSFNASMFEKKTFKSSSCRGIKKPLTQNYTHKKNQLKVKSKTLLQDLHEDIALIMTLKHKDVNIIPNLQKLFKILIAVKELLLRTLEDLHSLNKKSSAKLIKISDEKYFDSIEVLPYQSKSFFCDSPCCENEIAIDARRLLAVLAKICRKSRYIADFILGIMVLKNEGLLTDFANDSEFKYPLNDGFLKLFLHICQKINLIGCSYIYTGLLTTMAMTVKNAIRSRRENFNSVIAPIFDLVKEILYSRPNITVLLQLMKILNELSKYKDFLDKLCRRIDKKIIVDYSQGVSMYSHETCFIQVLSNQVEAIFHHSESLGSLKPLFVITNTLLQLLCNGNKYLLPWSNFNDELSCRSNLRIHQCMLFCLRKCSWFFKRFALYIKDSEHIYFYNTVLKSGIMILSHCTSDDNEFISRLGDYEGYFQWFLSDVNSISDLLKLLDIHKDALSDLTSKTLSLVDDNVNTNHNDQIWEEHFSSFNIND